MRVGDGTTLLSLKSCYISIAATRRLIFCAEYESIWVLRLFFTSDHYLKEVISNANEPANNKCPKGFEAG